jgi:putative heme-binding domain-containing protein
VGNRGQQLGPDLTEVGRRLSPAQLFESLADPSRGIDPKYQSIILVTHEGKVVTGLLHEETKTQITLINSQGERVAVALEDVESRRLDTKSLMPSGMANDLTAQQAADLLAFLSSLR